jgi:hypothetical protein
VVTTVSIFHSVKMRIFVDGVETCHSDPQYKKEVNGQIRDHAVLSAANIPVPTTQGFVC